MVAPKGTAPRETAYWENVLARVVETDDWKKMLEEDVLTNQFMKSAETRSYLSSQYEELKAVLTALGMAK
jgi:putative tricarboxylic transport membrane protein